MTTTSYATFDLDDLVREFGDLDTIRELVAIVRNDLAVYAERLSASLAAGDHVAVRETAHAIKGAVSNVSARPCHELAESIDGGLKAGRTDVVSLAPGLILECQKLRAELGLWLESAQDAAQ